MVDQEWALIAFDDGAIRAGKVSEQYMFGRKVLRLEQASFNQDSNLNYRYYEYERIRGIRPSSQEEVHALQSDALIT